MAPAHPGSAVTEPFSHFTRPALEAAKTASFPLAARDDRTNLDTVFVSKGVVFGDKIVPSNNQDAFWYQIKFLQQILHALRSGDVHFPNRMVE